MFKKNTKAFIIPGSIHAYFIGAHINSNTHIFEWYDGSRLTFNDWATNEPDNLDTQPYVVIFVQNPLFVDPFKWGNHPNLDGQERFICELPLI